MTRSLDRMLRVWPKAIDPYLTELHLLTDFETMGIDADDLVLLQANLGLFPRVMRVAVMDWGCELARGGGKL